MDLDDIEGYHDAVKSENVYDVDHGYSVGYYIPALGMTVFTYEDKPDMISFHMEIEYHPASGKKVGEYRNDYEIGLDDGWKKKESTENEQHR